MVYKRLFILDHQFMYLRCSNKGGIKDNAAEVCVCSLQVQVEHELREAEGRLGKLLIPGAHDYVELFKHYLGNVCEGMPACLSALDLQRLCSGSQVDVPTCMIRTYEAVNSGRHVFFCRWMVRAWAVVLQEFHHNSSFQPR